MQKNSNIVITDTSCLILLSKIGEMDILKNLFNKVLITKIIADEFGSLLPSWIDVIG